MKLTYVTILKLNLLLQDLIYLMEFSLADVVTTCMLNAGNRKILGCYNRTRSVNVYYLTVF